MFAELGTVYASQYAQSWSRTQIIGFSYVYNTEMLIISSNAISMKYLINLECTFLLVNLNASQNYGPS